MFAIIVLLLMAGVAGSRSGKPDFWLLACLMGFCFIGFSYNWQYTRQFPGLLSSGFVAEVGKWVIAMVIGLMIGGLAFGEGLRKKTG